MVSWGSAVRYLCLTRAAAGLLSQRTCHIFRLPDLFGEKHIYTYIQIYVYMCPVAASRIAIGELNHGVLSPNHDNMSVSVLHMYTCTHT